MSLRPRLFVQLAVLWLSTVSVALAEGWISIGPFGTPLANHDVISGQTNAVAIDPRDVNVIYLGASEGGVWKTRDGGIDWIPLTDTQLVRKLPSGISKGTMSIGALAINPSNPQVVYAGTGDPNVACCFVGASLGVFRSTDGGSSWLPTGADPNRAGCPAGAPQCSRRRTWASSVTRRTATTAGSALPTACRSRVTRATSSSIRS